MHRQRKRAERWR